MLIFALESPGGNPSVHRGESKQSAGHVGTESCESVKSKEADARSYERCTGWVKEKRSHHATHASHLASGDAQT